MRLHVLKVTSVAKDNAFPKKKDVALKERVNTGLLNVTNVLNLRKKLNVVERKVRNNMVITIAQSQNNALTMQKTSQISVVMKTPTVLSRELEMEISALPYVVKIHTLSSQMKKVKMNVVVLITKSTVNTLMNAKKKMLIAAHQTNTNVMENALMTDYHAALKKRITAQTETYVSQLVITAAQKTKNIAHTRKFAQLTVVTLKTQKKNVKPHMNAWTKEPTVSHANKKVDKTELTTIGVVMLLVLKKNVLKMLNTVAQKIFV